MKTLKSSLLRKIILGYRIINAQERTRGIEQQLVQRQLRITPQYAQRLSGRPLNVEETAQALKLPTPTVEKIYNEVKEIQSNLPKTADKSTIRNLKNKIDSLEETAVISRVYLIPQIMNSISQTKEGVHELELKASQEIEPVSEVKKQIEELEREKKTLEEAKKTIMEKYYNRDIDELSVKNIMDNYEQRLVETDIKIKNWKEELKKLEKEPNLSQKSQKEKKERFFAALEGNKLSISGMLAPQISTFRLSKILKPVATKPTGIEQPPVKIPEYAPESETEKTEPTKRPVEKLEGIELLQIPKRGIKVRSLEMEEEILPISLTYPLIPRFPAENEHVFAYAKISWDENNNRYMYNLMEPKLTEKLKDVYQKVKEMLEQRLDIDFSKLKKIEVKEFLDTQVDDVLKYFNFVLTENEKQILKYYMVRDFIGLGTIEPLVQDPNIEDINCDGVGIPLFIFHRNPEISSVATNIMFNDAEQLDSFLIRLAQLCGKSISVSQPLLDGTLPDGSRIQATLGTDIARRGSNFTLRKFTEEPLTPVHLMNYGTLDANILAFLWFIVDYGRSILVSGGTATGKTSMLNILSLFIRPEKKIVSIEDTAELRLPHSHWVPVVARTATSVEGKGEVDMFELLKESLRQRPDYIVVGEVRGKEAYVLFQQMATGHPSLATMHAENIDRLTNRLTTPPISLPAGLISTLDIVIFLARMKYKNKFIRKVTEIVEIVDFDAKTNTPITNQIYKWDPISDKFEITGKSVSLKKISNLIGLDEKYIKNEIARRIVVLEWMKANNILDYRDVHKIFSIYYNDPERVLSSIQGAG